MYIKEVCLEGFKLYVTHTVFPGFDPFFNALIGLNGSGKSNILDSICFGLCITNLQQVRASNMEELVYKQGQLILQRLRFKRSHFLFEDFKNLNKGVTEPI